MATKVEKFYRCAICDKKATSGTAPCSACQHYVHFKCSQTSYKQVVTLGTESFICIRCKGGKQQVAVKEKKKVAKRAKKVQAKDASKGKKRKVDRTYFLGSDEEESELKEKNVSDDESMEVDELPEEPVVEKAVVEEAVPEEAMTEDVVAEKAVVEKAMAEKAVEEKAVEEKAVEEKALGKKDMVVEAVPEDALEEDAMPGPDEEALAEDALADEAATEEPVSEEEFRQEEDEESGQDEDGESGPDEDEESGPENDEVRNEIPYEFLSKTGKILGVVWIVKTNPGELVHGKELLVDEKKVLVKEVYDDAVASQENEEFVEGAFLRENKIFLRKMAYKRVPSSKKKGRGHKASMSPQKWTKNKRKKAKNSGLAYITSSNKEIPAKRLKPFNCQCRYTQCKEVSQEVKENEHYNFWKIGDHDKQNVYLLNTIETVEKGSSKAPKTGTLSKPKGKIRKYKIREIHVCKELFKSVYCVSNGLLSRILMWRDEHPDTPPKDKRGGKATETDPIVMEKLGEILTRLPKYTSHYQREINKDDNLVYLEPSLDWSKVYDLLKEEVEEEAEEVKVPKIDWLYQKVNALFPHIKTHTPTKDKCNTCSLFTLQEKLDERDAHQDLAKAFGEQLTADSKKKNFFCFDLQQVQPLPLIKENKSFYSRKMWLYNLGTNNGKKASMFIWTEIVASRGAREVTSCLYKFLNEHLIDKRKEYDPLTAWSDSCGGQNRNFIMLCLFLRILNEHPNIKSLVHRLPISGHSFLPNDRDFGDIEKAKRKKEAIYSVKQYMELMTDATKKKSNVIRMGTNDFKDFSLGINFKNLSTPTDSDGKKFTWLKIHEFRYEQGLFGFKFKYNLSDAYRTCLLGKPSVRSKRPEKPEFENSVPIVYPHGRKLKAPKVLDMETLMSFVPPVHQDYYRKIIEDHKAIIDAHKKKKKASNEEDEEVEELF